MNSKKAAVQLSALANETRLDIVRLLVPLGREGMPAGEIAKKTRLSASRLSFHLSALENAGLIWSRRESRNVLYAAHYPVIHKLIGYLMNDCCGAHPKVCGGLHLPQATETTAAG